MFHCINEYSFLKKKLPTKSSLNLLREKSSDDLEF